METFPSSPLPSLSVVLIFLGEEGATLWQWSLSLRGVAQLALAELQPHWLQFFGLPVMLGGPGDTARSGNMNLITGHI